MFQREAMGAHVSLTFQCYVYGSGRYWEAICVDLDIAVSGASAREAEEALGACIDMYLERVAELSPDERRRFLTRRSPWHVRARLAFMTLLQGLRGGAARSRGYTLHPHVPALP